MTRITSPNLRDELRLAHADLELERRPDGLDVIGRRQRRRRPPDPPRAPTPPPALPTGWTARASRARLRLVGWRSVYAPVPGPKGVFMVYPHTSNWDFPIGMLFRHGAGLQTQWMGKASLFRGPLGPLMRALGGVAIDRSAAQGPTAAIIDTYRRRDTLWLAITPEGTRSKVEHLKSGFHRIAVGANVPCGLAFIDYATRTVGVDIYVTFTGNEARDLKILRDYYATKRGKRPAYGSQAPDEANRHVFN